MLLEYSQVIYWNYERLLLLGEEAIYFLQVDIIPTGRYYDDVNITNGTLHSRLVTYTSHVNKTVSSSNVAIINVCIYSGIRFAPIHVPNYASSVCITTFFL